MTFVLLLPAAVCVIAAFMLTLNSFGKKRSAAAFGFSLMLMTVAAITIFIGMIILII